MRFEPQPNDTLRIGKDIFKVTPHPVAPYMAFGQEGRKSIVYQLHQISNARPFALKIFKPVFRGPYIVEVARRIARYATLPGMAACKRTVLTRDKHTSLIRQYPELEYAVLMPWITGQTWQDVILSNHPLSREQSLQLAQSAANVLSNLEARRLAHCDIAGGNVLVSLDRLRIGLVDLEDIYGPNMLPPRNFPAGTAGYQHRISRTHPKGQWLAQGDRFSSAVLLAEILTWQNPYILKRAYGEHFFAESELQDATCERYVFMLAVLYGIDEHVAELFKRAWLSPTLAHCPSLGEWATAIAGEDKVRRARIRKERRARLPQLYEQARAVWQRERQTTVMEQLRAHKTNLLLFLVTVWTTLYAGSVYEGGDLLSGAPFAFALLAIMGSCGLGQYFVARYHQLAVTLPYFLPMLTFADAVGIGTLGTILNLHSPIRNRKQLFDIGVVYPLIGLIVTIPLLVYGLLTSPVEPLPVGSDYYQTGNSLLYLGLKYLIHGKILPGDGLDVSMNSINFAAWVGLLVIGLNLLPLGQLSGGRVAYALFGRRAWWMARITAGILLIMGLTGWVGWLVWSLLSIVFGLRHPPPLNDDALLDRRRRVLGAVMIAVFILTFVPLPFRLVRLSY